MNKVHFYEDLQFVSLLYHNLIPYRPNDHESDTKRSLVCVSQYLVHFYNLIFILIPEFNIHLGIVCSEMLVLLIMDVKSG